LTCRRRNEHTVEGERSKGGSFTLCDSLPIGLISQKGTGI
jgi:hypothetical protein